MKSSFQKQISLKWKCSKRKLKKEMVPVKEELSREELIKRKVVEANSTIRKDLKELLEEFQDVFPHKLP